MKKLLLALLALPILTGCKEQYEKDIEAYYKENMKDYSNYERVSLSEPSIITHLIFPNDAYSYTVDHDDYIEFIKENCKRDDKDPNEFLGYYVIHEYLTRNEDGKKVGFKDIIYLSETKRLLNVEEYNK